jgi:hypothetical protein
MFGIRGLGIFVIGWERLFFHTAIEYSDSVVFSGAPRKRADVM